MKYFIGGVSDVYLYVQNDLILKGKTLTESSIETSIDKAEARGGSGNKLLGNYYHTANMTLTITDAIFDLQHLALNVGQPIETGGVVYEDEEVTLVAGVGAVTGTPVDFLSTKVGWAYVVGAPDVWYTVTFSGQSFDLSAQGLTTQHVCVHYPVSVAGAEALSIPAAFIPSTVHAVMIGKLYRASGAANDLANSSLVGNIVIDIPRFQLSGAMNLSMTANGVSTTPLSGSALASEGGSCEDGSVYGTFTVNIEEANWYDKIQYLAIEEADVALDVSDGDTNQIEVYGVAPNRAPFSIAASALTYTSASTAVATVSSAGVITPAGAGTTTIEVKITAKPTVKSIVKVTVTA